MQCKSIPTEKALILTYIHFMVLIVLCKDRAAQKSIVKQFIPKKGLQTCTLHTFISTSKHIYSLAHDTNNNSCCINLQMFIQPCVNTIYRKVIDADTKNSFSLIIKRHLTFCWYVLMYCINK